VIQVPIKTIKNSACCLIRQRPSAFIQAVYIFKCASSLGLYSNQWIFCRQDG
jgi:hypothetical protein